MLSSWLRQHRRKQLLSEPFPPEWLAYLEASVRHYQYLTDPEKATLRDDLRLFLAEKHWEGCAGLILTDEMKVTISAQACLLTLNLPNQYFPNVGSIFVYPSGYGVRAQERGPDGAVRETTQYRLGEAWNYGPVVLSWQDARHGGINPEDGRNVVLHEFAHKLDINDGRVDGVPRMHDAAAYDRWAEVMSAEYAALVQESEQGHATVLDHYGATNAGEFFAIATEAFFENPARCANATHACTRSCAIITARTPLPASMPRCTPGHSTGMANEEASLYTKCRSLFARGPGLALMRATRWRGLGSTKARQGPGRNPANPPSSCKESRNRLYSGRCAQDASGPREGLSPPDYPIVPLIDLLSACTADTRHSRKEICMSRALPPRPNLEQLSHQAKELRKAHQSHDPEAARRLREHLPRLAGASDETIFSAPLTLADAQLALAREYGLPSWVRLRKHVQMLSQSEALKEAITRNDLARVKEMLAANPALLQAPIGYGEDGPLTWAAECRGATPPAPERLAIARFLIEAGADVHAGGDGPLMRAALNDGRIPMMELLVAHGADVNALWHGTYPILCAPCEALAPRALQWLLEHGADPNCRGTGPYAGTPLDMVIGTYARGSLQQHECANLLIEAGATSQYDRLPTLEIHRGRLNLLARWLEEHPDLVHRRYPELTYGGTAHRSLDLKGTTLLHVAAEYCEPEAARMLLDHGAGVNALALVDERGVGGQSPIYHAVTQYKDLGVSVTQILIEHGADLTLRARVPGRCDYPEEWLEVTPLGYAVRFPYDGWACRGAIDLLLDHGAPAGDVYAAALLGMTEELRALLEGGADPHMRNLDGETALAAALANGHTESAALLRAAGAAEEHS